MTAANDGRGPLALDRLLTWREASTAGEAIGASLEVGRAAVADVRAFLADADRLIVTGAGSSYYLAQVVTAVAREISGGAVVAAPLSSSCSDQPASSDAGRLDANR